jgi:hypothetical protein
VTARSSPADASPAPREWWLRTLLVVQAPRAVFTALRDDRDETASERAEPVLLVVLLAGIASVLSTRTAAHLLDDHDFDGLLVAVWTFLAGTIYGGVAYWVFGGILHGGLRALGSQGTFRRSRHLLAFAAVPIALSLVLWPAKLALYGGDVFRRGGADAGTGGRVFELLGAAFLAWALALTLVGVRAVHGWSWGRSAAAVAAAAALLALFSLAVSTL